MKTKNIKINESLESERKALMGELTELGRKIKKLQSEYDNKIKEIHKLEDRIDKDKK